MKVRNEIVNNFMTITFKFSCVRVIQSVLDPVLFNLNLNLTSLADISKPETFSGIQIEGNIAYQKLYFWLESVLPGVVMVDATDKVGFGFSALVGNIIMHCPGEPVDELLVRMLHSKISAIVNSKLIIGEIILSADESGTSYTFVPDEHGYNLPDTVRAYLDLPSLNKKPWWCRKDGFCFEFVKGKDVKEKLEVLYSDIPDPLEEYEINIREALSGKTHAPAPIIEHDTWKPRKL